MAMQLAKTVTGIYVFEEGELVESTRFTGDEKQVAEKLVESQPLEEEYNRAERVVLGSEEIADLADISLGELRELQREVAKVVTEEGIRAAGNRDQLLVQAVRALDDLNEMNNDTSERLRPWYAVHFPELEEAISSNEKLAEIVAQEAKRDNLEGYEDMAETSTGIEIDDTDAKMMRLFATQLHNAYELREELEKYVELLAREVAPNLATLLGGLLAARIVSLAGSLEQLAKMPASTIQVLGAEKAMFRHMKGEGKAPKHGVLFMHPFVQNVSGENQGEMARVLANKSAIAARIDRYGGDFKGESLRAEVEERFENRHGDN